MSNTPEDVECAHRHTRKMCACTHPHTHTPTHTSTYTPTHTHTHTHVSCKYTASRFGVSNTPEELECAHSVHTHTRMHARTRAHIHTHHMARNFGEESYMADWYVVMSSIHQYLFNKKLALLHNHIAARRAKLSALSSAVHEDTTFP